MSFDEMYDVCANCEHIKWDHRDTEQAECAECACKRFAKEPTDVPTYRGVRGLTDEELDCEESEWLTLDGRLSRGRGGKTVKYIATIRLLQGEVDRLTVVEDALRKTLAFQMSEVERLTKENEFLEGETSCDGCGRRPAVERATYRDGHVSYWCVACE